LDTVRVGPYTVRLWLFADGDLSPANLGEAFDYYSAVPGWGWRAIAHASDGLWRAQRVVYGASHGGVAYALPEPEAAADSYFPCGREVPLREGGVAFEGGVPLPPSVQIGIGDELAVWVAVEDDTGEYRADLRFDLVENESWDALEPSRHCCCSRPIRGPALPTPGHPRIAGSQATRPRFNLIGRRKGRPSRRI
jgi:hypothetical protein